MTWFGQPYRDLVGPTLKGHAVELDHGLLVRLGTTPMDSDEVGGRLPRLPQELLASTHTGPSVTPDRGREPADVLTPLG